jgi:hypothetical protein
MKTGPAFPRTRYDGQGGYTTGSRDITFKAFLGGLVFVTGFVGVFWVLAAAGF